MKEFMFNKIAWNITKLVAQMTMWSSSNLIIQDIKDYVNAYTIDRISDNVVDWMKKRITRLDGRL